MGELDITRNNLFACRQLVDKLQKHIQRLYFVIAFMACIVLMLSLFVGWSAQ